jgi:hypothetical protein
LAYCGWDFSGEDDRLFCAGRGHRRSHSRNANPIFSIIFPSIYNVPSIMRVQAGGDARLVSAQRSRLTHRLA